MSFDIKGFKNPHLKDFSEYKTMYEQSVKNPSKFFNEQALKELKRTNFYVKLSNTSNNILKRLKGK